MLNNNYYCVIMAGGVGARFWPMSNSTTPKQFIEADEQQHHSQTVHRCVG